MLQCTILFCTYGPARQRGLGAGNLGGVRSVDRPDERPGLLARTFDVPRNGLLKFDRAGEAILRDAVPGVVAQKPPDRVHPRGVRGG